MASASMSAMVRVPRVVHQVYGFGATSPAAMASVQRFCAARGYAYKYWDQQELSWFKPMTYRSRGLYNTLPSLAGRAAIMAYNILWNEGGTVLACDTVVDGPAELDALLTRQVAAGKVLLAPRLLSSPAAGGFFRAVLDALPDDLRYEDADTICRRVGWPHLVDMAALQQDPDVVFVGGGRGG
jgi:hypothetical protein